MINKIFVVFVLTSLIYSTVVYAEEIQCFPNASVSPCGGRCEERCNAPPGIPSFCKGIQCKDMGCRCNDGYARDPDSNHCVLKSNCPINECAIGEFKGACGTLCEGTCESPTEPTVCQTVFCNNWSCRCDLAGGFVRNKQGKCVRKEEC